MYQINSVDEQPQLVQIVQQGVVCYYPATLEVVVANDIISVFFHKHVVISTRYDNIAVNGAVLGSAFLAGDAITALIAGTDRFVKLESETPQTINSDLVLDEYKALFVKKPDGTIENAIKYATYPTGDQMEIGSTAVMAVLNSKAVQVGDPATGGQIKVRLRLDYQDTDGTAQHTVVPTTENLYRKAMVKIASIDNTAIANNQTIQLITSERYNHCWTGSISGNNEIIPKYAGGYLTFKAVVQYISTSTSGLLTVTPVRNGVDLTQDAVTLAALGSGKPVTITVLASGICELTDRFQLKATATGAAGTIQTTDITVDCELFPQED